MKGLLSRIIAIITISTILLMGNAVLACADEAEITYSAEYADNSVTIMFYITEIDAFDVGAIYDPSLLTVTDCGYTKEFKMLQAGGENTTISVKNEDAKDDAGNTYVIFTGAGTNTSTGKSIDFSGKPLAYITFEGNLTASNIKLVSDTAAVSNVNEAELLGELSLSAQSGTVVTPEPVKDVVYITPAPIEAKKDTTNSTDTYSDDTTAQIKDSSVDDDIETGSEVNETEAPGVTEEIQTTEESDNEVKTFEETTDNSEEKKDKDTSINPIVLAVLIGVAVILVTLAVIVIIKNKKK